MRARRLVLLGIVALAAVVSPASAAASGESAAQRLAQRYAPIAMLREQQDPPCNTSEEQYQPTSVETMLGNPTVTLAPGNRGRTRCLPVAQLPRPLGRTGKGLQQRPDRAGDEEGLA